MTKTRIQKKAGELNLRLARLQKAARNPVSNYFTVIHHLCGDFLLLFTNTVTLPFTMTVDEAEMLVSMYEGKA